MPCAATPGCLASTTWSTLSNAFWKSSYTIADLSSSHSSKCSERSRVSKLRTNVCWWIHAVNNLPTRHFQGISLRCLEEWFTLICNNWRHTNRSIISWLVSAPFSLKIGVTLLAHLQSQGALPSFKDWWNRIENALLIYCWTSDRIPGQMLSGQGVLYTLLNWMGSVNF